MKYLGRCLLQVNETMLYDTIFDPSPADRDRDLLCYSWYVAVITFLHDPENGYRSIDEEHVLL